MVFRLKYAVLPLGLMKDNGREQCIYTRFMTERSRRIYAGLTVFTDLSQRFSGNHGFIFLGNVRLGGESIPMFDQ